MNEKRSVRRKEHFGTNFGPERKAATEKKRKGSRWKFGD
jgi:hypothetical protein